MNIAQITILQLLFHKSNQVKSDEIKIMLVFDERRKAEKRTNKLDHMTASAEMKPRPHWWKATSLSTMPAVISGRLPARQITRSGLFLL